MAVEDFTLDEVDDVQLHPSFNDRGKSAILNCSDERDNKFQSENHLFSFSTRSFGSAGLEDKSEVFGLDLLFNHIERSLAVDFPDGRNKEFQSKRLRYSSCGNGLNDGFVKERFTSSEVPSPDLSTSWTRSRWWNPVAVLSDLRPNIQYHRDVAGDTADADGGPDSTTLHGHGRRSGPVSISAVVDGHLFHGRGRTAKQAKRHLAADVLRTLFHFRFIGQKPGP